MVRNGEKALDWMPEGKTRIAEYYCFTPKRQTKCLMENGQVFDRDDLTRPDVIAELEQAGVSPTPVRTREVEGKQLTWCLINARTILEGNADRTGPREMPGSWIPVFPVIGEEVDLDGRVDLKGIVRDGKDPQRMSNYWKSAMTETMALAPKSPFVAEEGQLEGYMDLWKKANVNNIPVLPYRKVSIGGNTLVPPPQRTAVEAPIQGMVQLSLQSEQDLRAATGFSYDVGAHEPQQELSGRAILARQHQGETGNSHFQANQAVTFRHAGRVTVELLPYLLRHAPDETHPGRNGQQRTVIFHAGNQPQAEQMKQQLGDDAALARIVDLSAGRYNIRVRAGVSFSSQRDQEFQLATQMMQGAPAMAGVLAPILLKSMATPQLRLAGEQLEAMLPPNIQAVGKGQGAPQIPPQVQQQLQQAGQMITALAQRVSELTEVITTKKLEIEGRERTARIQAEATITAAALKGSADQNVAGLKGALQHIEHLTDIDLARIEAGMSAAQPGQPGQPGQPAAPGGGASSDGQAHPPAADATGTPPVLAPPPSVPSAPEPAGPAGMSAAGPGTSPA